MTIHKMLPLPAQYDTAAIEKKWQNHWLAHKTYAWDATVARADSYVIDTPPPTVSGTLHMGHVYSYTQADFIARFQRMHGKNVFYPMGFDDNGLPTERLVEKTKKIRAVDMSREAFIAECLSVSEEARAEFRELFQSIALSVDWEQEYHTISDEVRRLSQLSFLDLVRKGHAYRALKPFYWDPVDQTAIAQAEIVDKEMPSQQNIILFEVEGKKLPVMTTRPEFLPACVALMYHPDDASQYNGKTARTPLFNIEVPMIADEKVDKEKGTGLVMCCTFGDDTDKEWWEKHALTTRVILNKYGKIDLSSLTDPTLDSALSTLLQGKKVSNPDPKNPGARETMIALLKEAGLLTEQKAITHAVKCAERSGAPLEILPSEQWFVRVMDKKDALKEKAKECVWNPQWMRVRIEQWIDGLSQDWCISRQRYFGVPFPVWYSKRAGEEGKMLLAHENQLPVNPLTDLPAGYNREEVSADTDVMDTWATSSISPQISAGAITVDHPSRFSDEHADHPSRLRGGQRGGAFGIKPDTTRNEHLIPFAKSMRKEMTPEEHIVWEMLSGKKLEGHKFHRQQPIGNYIVDFVCMDKKLVIEIDGAQHATEQKEYDIKRSEFLASHGYKIVRFWNNEVQENKEGVYAAIAEALASPPIPPASGRAITGHDRFSKLFPADLRPQAHEIIRTWAFYTIVKAHLHNDEIPWKNLMISGWCLSEDKSKMSKSKGNVITPVALIEEKGTDAVRYWAATSRLGQDTAFSPDLLKIGKKLVGKLWNATAFAAIHLSKLDGAPSTAATDSAVTEALDQWILSRLGQTVQAATEAFLRYEYAVALDVTNQFFWADFCDNYLELIKKRVYNEDVSFTAAQQQSAVRALYYCLEGILKLYAPIVPHVTEELYAHIFPDAYEKHGSLHARGQWVKKGDFVVNAKAIEAANNALEVLTDIRNAKSTANVSIKFPVKMLTIPAQFGDINSWIADLCGAGNVNTWEQTGEKITIVLAEEADAA